MARAFSPPTERCFCASIEGPGQASSKRVHSVSRCPPSRQRRGVDRLLRTEAQRADLPGSVLPGLVESELARVYARRCTPTHVDARLGAAVRLDAQPPLEARLRPGCNPNLG